jgi:hypothetical protein
MEPFLLGDQTDLGNSVELIVLLRRRERISTVQRRLLYKHQMLRT